MVEVLSRKADSCVGNKGNPCFVLPKVSLPRFQKAVWFVAQLQSKKRNSRSSVECTCYLYLNFATFLGS